MTADELRNLYEKMNHPEEIFRLHDEFTKLDDIEKDKFRKLSNRDQFSMAYITAIEMKNKGTWDEFVKKWEQNHNTSGEDRLKEYMKERGVNFPSVAI